MTTRKWPLPHPLELALMAYGIGGLASFLLLFLEYDKAAMWSAFSVGCVVVGLMIFQFASRWDFDA